MSGTALTFLPRKVAKSSKVSKNVNQEKSTTLPRPVVRDTALGSHVDVGAKDKGKAVASEKTTGQQVYSDQDCAMLISLSLSDHALWSEPDLRRTLQWNSEPDTGKEGFIPLGWLLRSSPILMSLDFAASEASVARALRACASDELDVRMLVAGPSKSNWYKGKHASPADVGGFEVRRKDWLDSDASNQPAKEFSKNDWEKRTIYLENVPPHYRTIPGMARFTLSLLSREPDSSKPLSRIQNITLPPHHQDVPGDQPKCKGMGLVTLARTEDLQTLLHEWPWVRDHTSTETGGGKTEVREAVKFGFRTVSKVRWDQLNDEFLAYRRDLLDEIAASEGIAAGAPSSAAVRENEPVPVSAPDPHPPATAPQTDLSSPYPLNCLVFVRNIHTESNKTTLRTLFSAAFKTPAAASEVRGDGLDYVDFNKGTDSCHLRLATPRHCRILVDHFTEHRTVQARGLDDVGTGVQSSEKGAVAIAMEIVQGKKEALYWEKVPEKIRRAAVQTAVGHVRTGLGEHEGDGGMSRRKKRKRYN